MEFLDRAPRHLFFTGKGGVGKTSLACACAVALADRGRRVLLVSTDPASNLDEVLFVVLTSQPTAIPGAPGMFALNIDPQEEARAYRERVVGPYRNLLPEVAVVAMEEQLSGGCTVEIAAFDAFARLLGDPSATADFDHVLFDTAPTGHTLRLLSLPCAWDSFMANNTTGTSCLGPLAGLEGQRSLYEATVAALSDPCATALLLVARPDAASLAEAERAGGELRALGVRNQHLVINGLFTAGDSSDPLAVAMARRTADVLAQLPAGLARLPLTTLALAARTPLGVSPLREFLRGSLFEARDSAGVAEGSLPELPPLAALVDALAAAGRGVVLTMGKGGVGKTTVAAAIAVALAERGLPVRLTTTDPAAHVGATVNEQVPGLTVSRIDPKAETAAYSAEVLASAGAGLDEQGRAVLEEDLRSPCTEEVAVFRAFAREVAAGEDGFLVLDTAPTGHTLLLLDSALAYHREVTRRAGGVPAEVESLLPRLRDPHFARVLIVTLPEATPVHEAARLQDDLKRAGIEPFAWVINQSLLPLPVTDRVLRPRRAREAAFVREVVERHARRVALVGWQAEPPVGVGPLLRLAGEQRRQRRPSEATRRPAKEPVRPSCTE